MVPDRFFDGGNSRRRADIGRNVRFNPPLVRLKGHLRKTFPACRFPDGIGGGAEADRSFVLSDGRLEHSAFHPPDTPSRPSNGVFYSGRSVGISAV